jgi:hypothetical protein
MAFLIIQGAVDTYRYLCQGVSGHELVVRGLWFTATATKHNQDLFFCLYHSLFCSLKHVLNQRDSYGRALPGKDQSESKSQ